MQQLYTHLAERKRLPEAEFSARLGGPVLVFKPGEVESTERFTTGAIHHVRGMSWSEVKALVKDDAERYRVLHLGPMSDGRERVITLGRAPTNQVVLSYLAISKEHATLHVRGDGIFIKDLNSRNGTMVDAVQVGKAPIAFRPPATLKLGHIDLRCMDPKSFYAFLGELLQ